MVNYCQILIILGDGSGVYPQTKCAWKIFDTFDILQLGYWMIPQYAQDKEALVRRATASKRFVHALSPLNLDGSSKKVMRDIELYQKTMKPLTEQGSWEFVGKWEKSFAKESIFPWWPVDKHWGRQGDGRCHFKTREGADATL